MVATVEIGEILNGAFQVAGSPTDSCEVKLHGTSGDLLYEQDVSAASEPSGVWNGLALQFTSILLTFTRDSNGEIEAPNGFLLTSPASIQFNFWESGVTGNLGLDSAYVGIS